MENNLVFSGVVIKQTDYRTGVSRSTGKTWVKKTYLFEEEGTHEYKKSILADVFNEATQQWLDQNTGKGVEVRFEPRAREYNGRYYMDIRAVDVLCGGRSVRDMALNAQAATQSAPRGSEVGYQPFVAPTAKAEDDEFPF